MSESGIHISRRNQRHMGHQASSALTKDMFRQIDSRHTRVLAYSPSCLHIRSRWSKSHILILSLLCAELKSPSYQASLDSQTVYAHPYQAHIQKIRNWVKIGDEDLLTWKPDTEKAIERQVYTVLSFQTWCGEGTNGRNLQQKRSW